jgi:ATP-dependent helicase/DNAse subunit B
MMKLLLGAPNSGKTTTVLSQIVATLREGRGDAFLVVPSTSAAEVFFRKLKEIAPSSISSKAHSVVITFPILYQKVLRALGQHPIYLDALQRQRWLRKVVSELAEENALIYFNRSVSKPGLVHSLAAFINELWNSATDAQAFAKLTKGRSAKDRDISLIFRRYQTMLDAEGLIDAEGAGLLAIQGLEKAKGKQIDALRDMASYIAAVGFDFYAPDKVKLLSLLNKLGIETVAALSYEPDRDTHLWQKRTPQRFVDAGAEIVELKCQTETRFSALASGLMRDGVNDVDEAVRAKQNAEGAIKIFSAPDRLSEVRAIAREVKKLVIESGFTLDEITLICRSTELYAEHIERVFTESGIPFLIDIPLRLNSNSCVIAILRLLQLAVKDFNRHSLVDVLRSPYLSFSAFQLTPSDIDLLEQLSYKERITQGRNLWLEVLIDKNLSKKGVDEVDTAFERDPELHKKLDEKLNSFFESVALPEYASRKFYARTIRSLLEYLKVEERCRQGDSAEVDLQALDTLYRVLNTLTTSETNQPNLFSQAREVEVSRAEFLAEFERSIAAMSFDYRRNKQATVVIQQAHNLRPRTYQVLFIMGLIEGEFPKRSTERFPYTLAEREKLRHLGLDFAETTDDAGADLTQFHKAIAQTTDILILSYARTELTGGELLKSYLVDEVKNMTGVAEIRIAQNEKSRQISNEAVSCEELALFLTSAEQYNNTATTQPFNDISFKPIASVLTENLHSWENTSRALAIEQRRLSGRGRGKFAGMILNERLNKTIQQAFGEDYLWTASKINDYGNCPFKFFANSVLKLASLDEPSEGFTYDKLGSAYHEILEKTYKQLKEQGIALSNETIDKATTIVEEISEQIFQEYLDTRKVRKSRLWQYETEEIKKDILNLLIVEAETNQQSKSAPYAFEKRFGMGSEPPLVVDGDSGKIQIRGIIDRIDETDSGLVVIDYKTSRSVISAREATEGRNLQLPIYLMAANQIVQTEKPVESGYYLHVRSYKKGSELPNNNLSLEELTAQTQDYINQYIGKVRQAEFPIAPQQTNCHQRCSYHGLCRIQSLKTLETDE